MSTPPPAEAPAPPAEARVEKAEDSVKGEPDEIPPPTEAQEAHDSPSPSNSASEGEYSGSSGSGPDDAETANKNRNETQPPLPNEPLPGQDNTAPPLPNEPLPADPAAPPLPAEPVPEPEDDGWEFHWNPNDQSYWFYNRFTGVWQQENPRVPSGHDPATTTTTTTTTTATPPTNGKTMLSNPASVAGGYNPAIHGDYDENAWYAQNLRAAAPTTTTLADPSYYQQEGGEYYATAGMFNRRTGAWQAPDQGPERYSEEAKARRQLRAFYDVDAAANDMHDGRSLKAERAGKKPTRAELKAFKERRRAKKEEKRRAWLRD
ncbi:c52c6b54-8d5c-4c73-9f4a-34a147cc0a2e [Thermothielavioides terrestris]|uniref:C52c6b54-8d5c-4c73-9f4a-34a147cc0a2e n=1 Tax=Thermothielavioides terrestris TaxID=2587410 RepID=A0A3S4D4G0_9PEZI|nr:c52c6b54-8d5c-4c73-9f4a-34a147cc0a2e [Thermothielavioides terrestris]